VGEAFLGAEGRDDLRVRIELHAEPACVIAGLRPPQARNSFRGGIAMRAGILYDLAQLVDDVLWRREVRVSHAEIDDIGARRSRAGLQTVDLFEDVRWQTADFVKLFHNSPRGSTRHHKAARG